MTTHADEVSAELVCDQCGYDLRAHPQDGKCPECGMSVAESRRLALVPRRPAWRDSDPRWRRRMLAGVWVLVLIPLIDVLRSSGWAASIPVPNIFGQWQAVHTLDETFLGSMFYVYQPLVFCIGVVLLFSKERGRRRSRFDWTRRWGIICSYIVFLLAAAPALFISALVLAGISTLFQSMPLKYQPEVTGFLVKLSTTYLRYGPYSKNITTAVLVAFSSSTVLLACFPLFDALRSSASKILAAIIIAPLILFALIHLTQAGAYCVGVPGVTLEEVFAFEAYFCPELVASRIATMGYTNFSGLDLYTFLMEAAKWCIVLTIAIWLTIAQFASWRQRKKIGSPDGRRMDSTSRFV